MKKRFRVIGIFLLILMLSSTVFAEPIKVMVENNYLELSVNPVLENERTLVPLRAIFEAMGVEVGWDESTQIIRGTQAENIIILQLNNKIASINGKEVELDAAAKAIDGRTLVPVRFIAESLGAEVGWDQESKTVLINSVLVKQDKAKETKPQVNKPKETKPQVNKAKETVKPQVNKPVANIKPQVKTSGKYVGSTDSDKYHKSTCRWAKKIKKHNETWFDTVGEAQQKGYKACKVCKPK